MRILIHDYAGHPFQIQLSRALAHRGHTVLHLYCASLPTTPQATLERLSSDPDDFRVEGIRLRKPLNKAAFLSRWRLENEYGRRLARHVARFRPDVILSANTPLDAQRQLLRASRAVNARFVYWVQDLLGVATERLLAKKNPLLGVVGRYYARLERSLLRASDGIVVITEDFRPILQSWSIPDETVHVIENWSPLDDTPPCTKQNGWSRDKGLADKTCLLYAGTLGMKHNPDLLLQLALRFREEADVRIVVISQGLGANWLEAQKREHRLDNLLILGFQPFGQMPEVLGAADVLLAILEPDAGVFSVPSKVLTYMCAARPLLLAVPPENLAARIVAQHDSGIIIPPTDTGAFVQAAVNLTENPDLRQRMGANARRYAERTFDIDAKADAFEAVLGL